MIVLFLAYKQDPPSQSKFAAFRRSLNHLRHRISKRRRSKPPDWFLDKLQESTAVVASSTNPNAAAAAQNARIPSEELLGNRLCGRISVDPTLPSHYRVCVYFLFFLFSQSFVP